MNDIKIGEIYQHIPTGIIRRVVSADSNHVTFKEDATFTKFYCSTDDFKKFWKPYKASPYTNKRYMIDIKNIKGKLYRNTLSDDIERVIYADDDRVIVEKEDSSKYSSWDIDTFLEYWIPYKEDNRTSDDKVNHPSHYTWLKDLCGIEVIDITRWLPADISNAVKYLLRQGHKHEEGMSNNQKAIEDCKKAIWYINDYINNVLKK